MRVTRTRVYLSELGVEQHLTVLDCASCGMIFGITAGLETRRREDGKSFWCPNGHVNVWRQSELDKMKAERDRLKARARHLADQRDAAQEQATHQRHRAAAYKGKYRSQKDRIDNGVCPYCNRTFKDVRRHMGNQHPRRGEHDEQPV